MERWKDEAGTRQRLRSGPSVWGATENLGVTITTLDQNDIPVPASTSFLVRPESGRPDRFVSNAILNNHPGDDTLRFWPDYLYSLDTTAITANAYYLTDQYLNVTFGYPFSQTYALSSPPDVAVSAVFKDQLVPPGGMFDPAAYEVDVTWAGQGQEGTWQATVSLTNSDPYWLSPPQVEKTFQVQLVKGTFGALYRAWGNWDGQDAPYPLTVSPGATSSALPKTPQGDGSRLVLLALRGNRIGAGPMDYGDLTNDPSADTYLDTGTRETFRLSIVDAYNRLVPEGEFAIHSCPRLDHPPGALSACPDRVIQSTGGMATFTINDGVDNRGYMGIELTDAPLAAGTYFVKVESLGQQFRIKQGAELKPADGPEGEFQGAFALRRTRAAALSCLRRG